jgi:hypothetical protein
MRPAEAKQMRHWVLEPGILEARSMLVAEVRAYLNNL